jgi:hypothetical protein
MISNMGNLLYLILVKKRFYGKDCIVEPYKASHKHHLTSVRDNGTSGNLVLILGDFAALNQHQKSLARTYVNLSDHLCYNLCGEFFVANLVERLSFGFSHNGAQKVHETSPKANLQRKEARF